MFKKQAARRDRFSSVIDDREYRTKTFRAASGGFFWCFVPEADWDWAVPVQPAYEMHGPFESIEHANEHLTDYLVRTGISIARLQARPITPAEEAAPGHVRVGWRTYDQPGRRNGKSPLHSTHSKKTQRISMKQGTSNPGGGGRRQHQVRFFIDPTFRNSQPQRNTVSDGALIQLMNAAQH